VEIIDGRLIVFCSSASGEVVSQTFAQQLDKASKMCNYQRFVGRVEKIISSSLKSNLNKPMDIMKIADILQNLAK